MITVEEHLGRVLATVRPLGELDLTLLDAHGCVLAEDVVATAPVPGFDNSAMDGYAVRAADLAGAGPEQPIVLPVVGDVAAGPTGRLTVQPGLCVRIMTGAPLPPGADAVVPVEWTDGGTAEVQVRRAPEAGAHVRYAGEDVRTGDRVLAPGTYLGAAQVGLLAAVNRRSVKVRPKPRVVVLSTGSELVDVGEPLGPGQIVDSNSLAITAAVREAGGLAYRVGTVPDDARTFTRVLEDHLVQADCVVTTGGVSVGAYDVVKEALQRAGDVVFDQVAMQPGKPQGFGTVGPDATPFFGLPGNPVSALVSFEVFVRPALRRMLGAGQVHRPYVLAHLTEPLRSPPGRRQFLRVHLDWTDGAYVASAAAAQGSHQMASMAAANALAVVPEEVTELPAGAEVSVMVLERRGR